MTKEEQALIKVQTIFTLTSALAGVFLSVFLFKIGNLGSVIQFHLVSLVFLLLWYVATGWLFQKWTSRVFMKLSFLFFFLVYFLLFLLRESAINYLLILGALFGSGHGNFWSANNLAQYISTQQKTRFHYFGRQNFWISLASSSGPIVGGLIISGVGYINTASSAGYITLFFTVALLMAYLFFLTDSVPGFSGIQFSLRDIIMHRRKRNWNIVLFQQGVTGLWDVGFLSISGILIFLIVKEEFILGAVNTTSAVIFALASIWAAKILQKDKRYFVLGTILSPLALLFFAWQQNWLGIFSLLFVKNIFLPYINIPSSVLIYDEIDKINRSWQEKYHFLVERDLILGIARIATYLVLLYFFVGAADQVSIAKKWIYVVPLFPLLVGSSFLLLEKN